VMNRPIHADQEETDEKAHEFGDKKKDSVQYCPFRHFIAVKFRDLDLDDKQSDGNCEDGIAEKDHAVELKFQPFCIHASSGTT
jgi:hypothetical protein